jgi:hypothetical protein
MFLAESSLRPSAMAGYLASYYDVERQKVGERIVTSDEFSNVKYFFPLSLISASANYIASTNYYHCGRPYANKHTQYNIRSITTWQLTCTTATTT